MSISAQKAVFTYDTTKLAKGHDRFATHGTYTYDTTKLAKDGSVKLNRYGTKASYIYTPIKLAKGHDRFATHGIYNYDSVDATPHIISASPDVIINTVTQGTVAITGQQPEWYTNREQVLRYGTKASYIYHGKNAAIRGIDNRYRSATPATYTYTNIDATFGTTDVIINSVTQGTINVNGQIPTVDTYLARSATNAVYEYAGDSTFLGLLPEGSVIVNSIIQGNISVAGQQPNVITEKHILGISDAAKALYNYTSVDADLENITPNVIVDVTYQGVVFIRGQQPTIEGAVDYSIYRLNPPRENAEYPPGDTNFSTQVNGLIEAVANVAIEVDDAKENSDSLVENLQDNYLKYTLAAHIIGNLTEEYRFTNMADASDPQDYVPLEQARDIIGVPSFDDYNTAERVGTDDPGPFYANDYYKISSDGDSVSTFVVGFDNVPITVSSNTVLMIPEYNASYLIDYSRVDISSVLTAIYLTPDSTSLIPPALGDELKFLLINYDIGTVIVFLHNGIINLMGESQIIIDTTNFTTGTNEFFYVHFVYVGGDTGWFIKSYNQRRTI